MLSLSDKEVKESLKKNEEKLTLKFNTCMILINDIEHVVKNATNTWKSIYNLHKKSYFLLMSVIRKMMVNMKKMRKLIMKK